MCSLYSFKGHLAGFYTYPVSTPNRRLSQRNSQLEQDLAKLGEGFAIDADKDREIAYLPSLLKDNGIEPYGLPNGDRANSKGAE